MSYYIISNENKEILRAKSKQEIIEFLFDLDDNISAKKLANELSKLQNPNSHDYLSERLPIQFSSPVRLGSSDCSVSHLSTDLYSYYTFACIVRMIHLLGLQISIAPLCEIMGN